MHTSPETLQRADDLGWIASTPRGFHLSFAVVGATEQEAVDAFAVALERWESLPLEPLTDDATPPDPR